MAELKTLKDLGCAVTSDNLRDEAVAWIKKLQDCNSFKFCLTCGEPIDIGYPYHQGEDCEDKKHNIIEEEEGSLAFEQIIIFLKHFFNLEESDLN